MTAVTGTFTATGVSTALQPVAAADRIQGVTPGYGIYGSLNKNDINMNVSLSGTWGGTVLVERSFDGGTTYFTYSTHTANVETRIPEGEEGVLYRFRCSIFTSGDIDYRISV